MQHSLLTFSFHFYQFLTPPTYRSLRVQGQDFRVWNILFLAMFRRLPHSLPADPVFNADLEHLGFFVNENDQIRMIKNPTQKYQYQINRNDRVNQVYKAANNGETFTGARFSTELNCC